MKENRINLFWPRAAVAQTWGRITSFYSFRQLIKSIFLLRSVCPAQNTWSRTTRAFICSQINQRFSPNRDAKAPFNQISRLPAERVVLIKKQGFPRLLCQWQTVLWTQTQKTPPPPIVPTQQFKLQRFCFWQDGHLWESKLGVTLQVRPVWDTRGGSGTSEGPASKGGRGESCPLTSRLHSWPRGAA